MKQGVQVGFEKSMLSLAEYIGRKKDWCIYLFFL